MTTNSVALPAEPVRRPRRIFQIEVHPAIEDHVASVTRERGFAGPPALIPSGMRWSVGYVIGGRRYEAEWTRLPFRKYNMLVRLEEIVLCSEGCGRRLLPHEQIWCGVCGGVDEAEERDRPGYNPVFVLPEEVPDGA